MNDDFWKTIIAAELSAGTGSHSLDGFLSGRAIEADFDGVRALTDNGRNANALPLPVQEGTKVAFIGNLGSVLAYADPPRSGAEGTVVTVKSAGGNVTAHDGMVFVKWDTGGFMPVHATHLRMAKVATTAAVRTMRVGSLGDLTEFLKVSKDTLVHKATKDLWSFRMDGSSFLLERLFDTSGDPLKG